MKKKRPIPRLASRMAMPMMMGRVLGEEEGGEGGGDNSGVEDCWFGSRTMSDIVFCKTNSH